MYVKKKMPVMRDPRVMHNVFGTMLGKAGAAEALGLSAITATLIQMTFFVIK